MRGMTVPGPARRGKEGARTAYTAVRVCGAHAGRVSARWGPAWHGWAGHRSPLGDLLRTISVMYRDFLDAYEMRGTTEAEAIRTERVVDAAVELEVWLRSDQ